MNMLFVKLRDSGDVMKVTQYARVTFFTTPERFGKMDLFASKGKYEESILCHLGKDCDLCDEQGRLLKPEIYEWVQNRIEQLTRELEEPEILDKARIESKLEAYSEVLTYSKPN